MPDTATLATHVATEALAFADLLDALTPDDRAAPTPCPDWTIADLAEHVAAGAFRDAESFHRARVGTASPPGEIILEGDASAAIRLAIEHLRAAVDAPPAAWPAIPMAFGAYPLPDALQCLVIEFGVHTDDLRRAAGERAPLSHATRDALFHFGEDYLLLQATPLETAPVTFTLAAHSLTMSVTWTGSRWRRGASASRACRIRGTDDAIARLMLRRLDVGNPVLDVHDPTNLASLFPSAIRPL